MPDTNPTLVLGRLRNPQCTSHDLTRPDTLSVDASPIFVTQDAVGWASSILLLLTISKQVYKQWKSGATEGISKWLFLGNFAASIGFTAYSWMLHNWIFVVTNGLMILNNIAGFVILMRNRRRQAASPQP